MSQYMSPLQDYYHCGKCKVLSHGKACANFFCGVMGPLSSEHKCVFKRYVGLQKVIDYCECGKEVDVDWKEAGTEEKT